MDEIYCADMTMLIGASSRVRSSPGGYCLVNPHAISDPESSQCFECLATIVCNDTRIYFQKPERLPFTSPIIEAWQSAAQISDLNTGSLSKVNDGERFEVMLQAFVEWLNEPTAERSNSLRLADWTAFQFSEAILMKQFWENNDLQDLQRSLEVLRARPVTAALAEAIRQRAVRADSLSRSLR